MNDRFKFRIWCEDFKEWEKHETLISSKGYLKIGNMQTSLLPRHHVIEQCTGLRDKNGVLIYENDIVNVKYDINNLDEKAVVKWLKEDAAFTLVVSYDKEHSMHGNGLEIIGNIHENPELMEK